MPFKLWHQNVVEKAGPVSDLAMYARVSLFGLCIFVGNYLYVAALQMPNVLNKSMALTSVWLIGFFDVAE